MPERRQSDIRLYERVAALEAVITETRDDVRSLIQSLGINETNGTGSLARMNVRIIALEGWRKWVNGGAFMLSVLVGALTWLWDKIVILKRE